MLRVEICQWFSEKERSFTLVHSRATYRLVYLVYRLYAKRYYEYSITKSSIKTSVTAIKDYAYWFMPKTGANS